jgi:hypothetical protein
VATSTQDTCERVSTAEPSGPAAPAPADGQQQQQQQQKPQRKQCEEGIFAGDISRRYKHQPVDIISAEAHQQQQQQATAVEEQERVVQQQQQQQQQWWWWQDLNTGLTQVYETARASAA